jgi:SAM-dependent methyltransferase
LTVFLEFWAVTLYLDDAGRIRGVRSGDLRARDHPLASSDDPQHSESAGDGRMTSYGWMYRLGVTPWERYGAAASESIEALLDREEAERSRPLGRALDLGCGRGQFTPELARRGWRAVGVDHVPQAIEAARKRDADVTYLVGDVTDLTSMGPADLGTFDFFLDVGCFQGFDADQPGWEMLAVEPASTAGLGWPMSRTTPRWYRLRRS